MDTPQAITDARSNAARLGNTAADFAAGAQTIPDQLKKAVNEALNYNADILKPRASALSDYFAAPSQAEAKYGTKTLANGQQNPDFIFNPFERNSLIQGYITQQLTPFTMYNSLLGARQGSAADTINAGTSAFNAQAVAAQKASDAAQQTYKDVYNEFVTNTQLGQEQQKIDKSGGGSDLSSILGILQTLLGGQQQGGAGATGGGGSPFDAAIEPDKTTTTVPTLNSGKTLELPNNVQLNQPNQNPNPNGLSLAGNNNAFSNLKSLNIKGLKL